MTKKYTGIQQPLKVIVGLLALILTGGLLILLNCFFNISILFNSIYLSGWVFLWVWGLSDTKNE